MIVRWFSHEVADLEPVLGLLQAQDMQDHEVDLFHSLTRSSLLTLIPRPPDMGDSVYPPPVALHHYYHPL